jgi:hypothetical protein
MISIAMILIIIDWDYPLESSEEITFIFSKMTHGGSG